MLLVNRKNSLPFIVLAGLVFMATGGLGAVGPRDVSVEPPAEAVRLGVAAFRAGLQKRGLTELLALHLADFPPADETEALLMRRDVKLAEFADTARPREERRVAVAEANEMLDRLIELNSDDPRHLEWRFTLAHSLIYDEGEEFLTNILYRGGSSVDRQHLGTAAARAVVSLRKLLRELSDEFDRVDQLSVLEFDKIEKSGYLDRLDTLLPRAEYLWLWALFYDALPRDRASPVRLRDLSDLTARLSAPPSILDVSHDRSHVQVQALLLGGMAFRRLNKHETAAGYLDRAIAVADSIADIAERGRVEWAVTLSRIEGVRNERDRRKHDAALSRLAVFRREVSDRHNDDFGLQVVAALLERSIFRDRAKRADRDGRSADAKRLTARSWQSLARLARGRKKFRDELYAMLYQDMVADVAPQTLDAFEQAVLIAGLQYDAAQSPEHADALLRRALSVGERFLTERSPAARSLVPEVLFNVAVVQYRLGDVVGAARRLLEVAREHTTFSEAPQAATLAVQLGAELYGDANLKSHPEVQQLYRDALATLFAGYGRNEAARYWKFYYAQLLEDLGEFEVAAAQYALVDPRHEHALESAFSRARCLSRVVQELATEGRTGPMVLQRRTDEFTAAKRAFAARASGVLASHPTSARAKAVAHLSARARVLAAEIQVLAHVDHPDKAIDALEGFEAAFPGQASLAGRVWRVRLLAYERLGRLDEATRAIPSYLATGPENGAAMLQSLYVSLADQVQSLRDAGDTEEAQRKADMSLVLAGQMHEAGMKADASSFGIDRATLVIQLAEANLRAGNHERARDLLTPLLPKGDAKDAVRQSRDLRVLSAYAEALFQLGDHALALPAFNRLATTLSVTDPIRWKSLLRDLQCRTAMSHPPRGIIKVIDQQGQLFPGMGGKTLAAEFQKVRRENERRADGG